MKFKKTISLILSMVMLLSITAGLNFSAYATDYTNTSTSVKANTLTTGDTFQMGMYPQSVVMDKSRLSALNQIECEMTSYGYMKNSNASTQTYEEVNMKYADISYNGDLYRKVKIDEYRPYDTENSSGSDNTYQDDNAYTNGTYYFKWEPIVWQVLAKEEDGVYVMSKELLDSQEYHNYRKDITWETSSLRKWLNNDFYNIAFSENEKNKILTRKLLNNTEYNTPGGNDTWDDVWVLSYSDALYAPYGFSTSEGNDTARQAKGTEYAQAQGLYKYSSNECSWWWLRTRCRYANRASIVNSNGDVNLNYYDSNVVNNTKVGVRPALKINLTSDIFQSDAAEGGAANSENSPEEIIYTGGENIKLSDVIGNQTFCNYIKSVNSTEYAPKLSYLLSGLSRSVYGQNNIKNSFESLGFNAHEFYNYTNSATIPGHVIGKQTLSDGSVLVLVTVRGSKTIPNWMLNFSTVATTDQLGFGQHAGFVLAANTVYNNLKSFMGGTIPTSNVRYVITGHSLGGATANLLAKKLADGGVPQANIYDYNFACPDTVRGLGSGNNHNCIFNLGSAKDAVSVLPGVTFDVAFTVINKVPGLPWGKYGNSYWFSKDWNNAAETTINLAKFEENHGAENYVDYMAKLKPLSAFKTWAQLTEARGVSALKSVIHAIFCPVDVDVYDENGKLVASVKNNEVVLCDVDSGVLVFVEDDHKYVTVPEDKNFNIVLTGTDTGTMDYTISKTDLNTQTVEETKAFENVVLTQGKTMRAEAVANADVQNTKLYVVNEASQPIAEIQENGQEIATNAAPTQNTPQQDTSAPQGTTLENPPTQPTTPAPAQKVKLSLKKVAVKKSAKKLVLQATLKINGKAVKGKKVTFKFNGKKYTAKTNKKGIAKVTVKKSVLKKLKKGKKITYSAKYGKKTVKKTAKVK